MLNLSWAPHPYTFLVFIALVPFLKVATNFRQQPLGVFLVLFSGFFVFHASAAWWMYSSTIVGSLMAHLLNAFLPAAAMSIWGAISWRQDKTTGKGFLFIALWMTMEWLNTEWPLAWPWFQLGHVFGFRPMWVQWYSLTTSAGGTLWVLMVNYLFFISLSSFPKVQLFRLSASVVAIILPVMISRWLPDANSSDLKIKVAIVQPNIHPQREKFGGMDALSQLQKAASLLEQQMTDGVDYAVFPETLIVEPQEETLLESSIYVKVLREKMSALQLKGMFVGGFTKRSGDWHPSDRDKAFGAKDRNSAVLYNSLLFITQNTIEIYHKVKLVPLVEKQPFFTLFKPLQKFVESSGGFFGSYGTHNERDFFMLYPEVMAIPSICFESAFACHPYPGQSPSFMVLITNDGWWSSSGGHLQHLQLARLRAIERQQWIIRAANTGVSCFITPRGDIVQPISYNSEGVIVAEVGPTIPAMRSCLVLRVLRWSAIALLILALLKAGKRYFLR